ncbi:MAG: ATP-binding protein [Pseudomonadota bacterium]
MTHTPRLTRRSTLAPLLGLLVLIVALATAALPRLERLFLIQTGDRSSGTLELAIQVMRGALSRTEALPALIAERPILTEVLANPSDAALLLVANEQLRRTALSLGVSDIYLMDPNGLTLAASSYRTDRSFVGRNFAFRPYFTDALAGGLGRFYALGTTSNQRGYFFAAPVRDGTEVIGVVAVKMLLDRFEATWAENEATIIVTDPANVVFLSDRADWHFRTLGPVSEAALEQIAVTRQYPLEGLRPIPARRSALAPGYELVEIADGGMGYDSYVMETGLIAAAGWRVSILSPTGPARVQAITVLSLAGLVCLFLGYVAITTWERRRRMLAELHAQQSQATMLEARVRERTEDLDAANRQLRQEVDERRDAEMRLRKTQAELVQAGKLAALGQMSAALSHEFNQPLAAVKAYAENAATFLDRGRVEDARDNVTRISGMADRMASISKHLRNFARRPQDKSGPVSIHAVIQDALDLMEPRLSKSNAKVVYEKPEEEVWVIGGRVRLQQVIVNLIGNALDAMEQTANPVIEVAVTSADGARLVTLRDHGPGLSDAALSQAFDPFFTTKDPGQGLGLGLSISYNIVRDFNGHLSAENHPDGGAVFTVRLEATPAPDSTLPDMAAQ